MSATEGFLERALEERLFTRGAQVSVSIDGEELLDIAVGDGGLGHEVTTETLFKVYCSIKPVTTLAVARLVEQGRLSLDDPLSPVLPSFAALRRGVTLRHVLTHTAGIQYPSALYMEMTPPGRRRSLLEEYPGELPWQIGRAPAYSEHFAWHLLGWLVEEVTGDPLFEHLRDTVLEPLGLADTYVGMTREEHAENLHRIGLNHDMKEGWPGLPLLTERTERVCRETNPAYGGYTTARDLRSLYEALLAQLDGIDRPGLPSREILSEFCSTARARSYDVILGRECEFGLGFMTGLADHLFGDDCSERAFGHSGVVGSSFAFADPDHGLAIGVALNGIVDAQTAFLRRRGLVRAIYRDADRVDASPTGS